MTTKNKQAEKKFGEFPHTKVDWKAIVATVSEDAKALRMRPEELVNQAISRVLQDAEFRAEVCEKAIEAKRAKAAAMAKQLSPIIQYECGETLGYYRGRLAVVGKNSWRFVTLQQSAQWFTEMESMEQDGDSRYPRNLSKWMLTVAAALR